MSMNGPATGHCTRVAHECRPTTNAKDQPNQANTDTTTTRRAWRVWASGGDERVIGAERRHPNHTKNANATTPTTVRNSTIRRRLFSLRTSCRSRSTVPIHWSAGGWVDHGPPGSKIRVLDGPPLRTGTSVTAEVRVFGDDGANLVRQRHFEFSEGYLARSCPKALSQFSRW